MKNGWVTKKLGEVCDFLGDGDWIESKDQALTGIRLIQTGNVGQGYFIPKENNRHYISESTFSRLHCTEIFAGDILVSRLPEPVGRACLLPECEERMITAVDCSILRLNRNFCDEKYIVYYASSAKWFSDIEAKCTGSTRKRISRKNLQSVPIPIPPLAEQKRIVAKIDAAFEKIDKLKANAERNLANAKELFQSALDEAMRPKEGWVEKRLGEVGPVCMCKRILKSQTNTEDGVPFYKIGTFGKEPNAYISQDIYERYRKLYKFPQKGDVLISAAGTIGRTVVYDGKPAYFQDSNIVWIANCEQQVLNSYLKWFYATAPWNVTKGTTILRLYNENIESAVISFPPLSEQREIVKRLDLLAEKIKLLEQNYTRQIADCVEMRQAVLREAFEGRL